MFDAKIETLLEVISAGSYTRAAQRLSLTQPAVSHHMRQLEQEFGIPIFYKDKKELRLTPEGEILVKYARRALAVYRNARQAIEDSRTCMSHIGVGITTPWAKAVCRRCWPNTAIRRPASTSISLRTP